MPAGFAARIAEDIGEQEATALLASLELPSTTGLRVRTADGPVERLLAQRGWEGDPLPWAPAGALLLSPQAARHPATLHPWQDAGAYYLQDPAAMGVVPVLDPQPGERVLDLAAAPGGKSTYLADRLGSTGLLWCHDVEPRRVDSLVGNLERWGAQNAVVSQGPVALLAPLGASFDRILLDAPCSGEGLFRKSASARRLWSLERIDEFVALQAELLEVALSLLRPGGVLVYSTCTFNTSENERQVAKFCERHEDLEPEPIAPAGAAPGLAIAEGPAGIEQACARWWPQRQHGEGHFVARLRRNSQVGGGEGHEATSRRRWQPFGEPLARQEAGLLAEFLDQTLGLSLTENGSRIAGLAGVVRRYREQLWLVPGDTGGASGAGSATNLDGGPLRLPGALEPRRVGTPLGFSRKGRFEPHHALSHLPLATGAASGAATNAAPRALDLALDDPRLGSYLRGESISASTADGWLLVRAEGLNLGWAKSKRGELNNRYPRGLRRQAPSRSASS